MENNSEAKWLDEVSKTYECRDSEFLTFIKEINRDVMLPFMQDTAHKCALELGAGEGDSTMTIAPLFQKVVVRDGSVEFLEKAKVKLAAYSNVEFSYGMFEDITEEYVYDVVIANYIFEHVDDVNAVLQICYRALKAGGILFITVPNATALSRQLAFRMGLIDDLYDLTENDRKHGHKRVFDMNMLCDCVRKTQFHIVDKGGLYVKEFADFQLKQMVDMKLLTWEHFKGMRDLAKDYPDISGSIWMCLQKY